VLNDVSNQQLDRRIPDGRFLADPITRWSSPE